MSDSAETFGLTPGTFTIQVEYTVVVPARDFRDQLDAALDTFETGGGDLQNCRISTQPRDPGDRTWGAFVVRYPSVEIIISGERKPI